MDLAELAVDLALCILAVEESRGSPCEGCSCVLKYHLSADDGDCELCGCIEIRVFCAGCGLPRIKSGFGAGISGIRCSYCLAGPSMVKILPSRRTSIDTAQIEASSTGYNRAREARLALKELSD